MCGRGFKPIAVPNYPFFVRSSSAKTVSANEPVPAGHPAVPSHTRLPSAPAFFDHPSSTSTSPKPTREPLQIAALDLKGPLHHLVHDDVAITLHTLTTRSLLPLSASQSRRFGPHPHVALTIPSRFRPQHRYRHFVSPRPNHHLPPSQNHSVNYNPFYLRMHSAV
ncbi:hypothetical protein P3342_010031 [Pyrenophora teres f. teres]|nr:hypothetical protein P3342_010031 [Pyrenophora teres f. teres]